ncbi:MAG: HD domain-containing protein [Chloroflexi bacterium]|nr:HD domain-containing protein [Chloroflexota bacterium]
MSASGESELPFDQAALARAILAQYRLGAYGVHGISHWARVLENGRSIARCNGADVRVVTLFALFHDACRCNESRDHGHGARGASLALNELGALIPLAPGALELLADACARHTDGLTSDEPTLQACWDADRLDLLRVGIYPNPSLLSSAVARELIPWANARAESRFIPSLVNELWGVQPPVALSKQP